MDRRHRRLFIGSRNPKMVVMIDADYRALIPDRRPRGYKHL